VPRLFVFILFEGGMRMKNNNTQTPINDIDASRMYTRHGEKHNQGHPIRLHGRNALAFCVKGKVKGFTYLDEINELFDQEDIPDYDPI
jgi:hypothetical protein